MTGGDDGRSDSEGDVAVERRGRVERNVLRELTKMFQPPAMRAPEGGKRLSSMKYSHITCFMEEPVAMRRRRSRWEERPRAYGLWRGVPRGSRCRPRIGAGEERMQYWTTGSRARKRVKRVLPAGEGRLSYRLIISPGSRGGIGAEEDMMFMEK